MRPYLYCNTLSALESCAFKASRNLELSVSSTTLYDPILKSSSKDAPNNLCLAATISNLNPSVITDVASSTPLLA
eukprot:9701843-Ditylum_brightwellii.AAC.2